MDEKDKTVGDVLLEALEKRSAKYNDLFTALFVYGPDILSKTIEEIEQEKKGE